MKLEAGSKKLFFVVCLVFLASDDVFAQSIFKGFESLFTPPLSYVVHHINSAIVIDGDMNEPAWQQAEWTSSFTDIEGSLRPSPKYNTQVKMLWGDTCLYIAAHLTEPQVWATLKQHDQVIFNDNDFEVFVNPDGTSHHYYEIEFNALNTVFDLYMAKPYRNGGSALIPFNLSGLRSAVKVDGTLNNPADADQGWTVEMAIPFRDLSLGDNVQIPVDGQVWRINFSRVEWDTKVENGRNIRLTDDKGHRLPEHNWVWSAQGVVNMHYPERWGYLQFTKQDGPVAFVLPYSEQQKKYLWLIYYKQKQWFDKYHRYAVSLKQLGIVSRKVKIGNLLNTLSMEATAHQFMVFVSQQGGVGYHIDQDGFVQQTKTVK
ncbi:carbohydrate-binding family 9-like protein [uncultured Mucilaginibacter sp.]|uniref:carbohydrate-binding family 9-like protein n=1 Tax=uncultured Mucilaginibacter sp. TaxID=797541 RepID=UPI0025F0C9DD|nr:carbohydrate-binding family 9-like protein [uncultured Mucilaginibacter sp.]